MRERAMRLIVYFDLPVKTSEERRRYAKFRKHLVQHGFVMLQKSVYSKIAVNASAAQAIKKDIIDHRPAEGNVQILSISEKQYQRIEVVVGDPQREVVDTMDRFVVLRSCPTTSSNNLSISRSVLCNGWSSKILRIWDPWSGNYPNR